MRRLVLLLTALAVATLGCVEQRAPTSPTADAPDTTITSDAEPAILKIEGQGRTIEVFVGRAGLLYAVRAADGRLLVPPIDLRRMRAEHPDVYREINTAYADMRYDASRKYPWHTK